MVEYLCRTGEAPCYLDMPRVNRNAVERREAFERAMTKLMLEPIVLEAGSSGWNFEAIGFEATNRLLDGRGIPSRTVLCANDRLALGVMAAAYQRKLKVGRDRDCDLRVAGHDDHPLSRYACPALTTVAQNYSQIAKTCVDVLLEMIDSPESEQTAHDKGRQNLFEARLIMRESA